MLHGKFGKGRNRRAFSIWIPQREKNQFTSTFCFRFLLFLTHCVQSSAVGCFLKWAIEIFFPHEMHTPIVLFEELFSASSSSFPSVPPSSMRSHIADGSDLQGWTGRSQKGQIRFFRLSASAPKATGTFYPGSCWALSLRLFFSFDYLFVFSYRFSFPTTQEKSNQFLDKKFITIQGFHIIRTFIGRWVSNGFMAEASFHLFDRFVLIILSSDRSTFFIVFPICAGPCISSAEHIIVTSAPTIVSLNKHLPRCGSRSLPLNLLLLFHDNSNPAHRQPIRVRIA